MRWMVIGYGLWGEEREEKLLEEEDGWIFKERVFVVLVHVVSSRKWLFISRYRASVRSQSSRVEMIHGLFKHVAPNEDEGMIRELLEDFDLSTPKLKPQNIIIFRDGVNESQFNQERSLTIKFAILNTMTSTYVLRMDRSSDARTRAFAILCVNLMIH
ncbi:hypothetical protein QVD17_40474 [Tagetes erecta]|uniref:Piwi domain-containing protein n=1 Tax=Tagetes erecta TaxID=13708 RepID=A0AAD8JQ04_TARER|nr:hypothetical protein QVD17_40474 [Tagetes erecta]